ncbi:MAG: SixA phosphatase family protein [Phycisphaerales bacterium JB059]
MVLYVIRHGKAHPDSPTGRDRDRALKPKGFRQAAYLGERLRARTDRPTLVVTSTFRRAYETAERINDDLRAEFVSDTRLCVDEPVSLAVDLIAEHADHEAVCVVGHNPQLEYLCAALTGGVGAPPVRVRTGEAFWFTIEPGDPLHGAELIGSLRLGDEPD